MCYENRPLIINFGKPVELKKGKKYLLTNKGNSLPMSVMHHIAQELKKFSGSSFVIINDNMGIEEVHGI